MTLLINDFCMRGDLRDGYILTVADRQISYKKGHPRHKKPLQRPKVFDIQYLNATIGYFGLADYRINKDHPNYSRLSDLLQSFIYDHHAVKTIGEFARALCDKLNYLLAKEDLEEGITGFHICGYNDDDIPEFWVVRNKGDDYTQPNLNYYLCEEKFSCQGRRHGWL